MKKIKFLVNVPDKYTKEEYKKGQVKEFEDARADVFYAMSKISDEDYTSLTLKVEELYKVEATETTEVTGPSTEENVESEG